MRRKLVVAGSAVVVVFGLGFLVAPRIGWATAFGLPHHFTFNGKTYVDGDANVPDHYACERHLPPRYARVRSQGSMFGYFTSAKPILVPKYEWRYPFAHILFIRNGDCFQEYIDIADGP